jgi:16S rRNA (uracil1498-N3)-methyltransferase
MRIQVWEHIILFSWDGNETEYEILAIEKRSIWLRWISQKTPHTESSKKISLYQALPNKYEKIEYILQKWVEIGISRFVFFRSERSQKLLMSPAKIERFLSIAREALEQCGGVRMPDIIFLNSFPENLDMSVTHLSLDTIGEKNRIVSYDSVQEIWLWVGPEGGWSDTERWEMIDKWFIFARFGERVLRTETAGIVIAFGFMNA